MGHATPDFFFEKKWRNSKQSGAFYGPMAPSKFCCFFGVFYLFKMLPLQTGLKTKQKEEP